MKSKKFYEIVEFAIRESLSGEEFYQVDQYDKCLCPDEDDYDCGECVYCKGSYMIVRAYAAIREEIFDILNDAEYFDEECKLFFEEYFAKHEYLYMVEMEDFEDDNRMDREIQHVYFFDEEKCKAYCDTYFD